MELKSRLRPSFRAISTYSISSQTTQGKYVHGSVTYISSSISVLFFHFYSSVLYSSAQQEAVSLVVHWNEVTAYKDRSFWSTQV